MPYLWKNLLKRYGLRLLSLLLVVEVLGCGGGGGSAVDGSVSMDGSVPDGSVAPIECTPDPALIAERRDCLTDDHCPCQTHCDLGLCLAECAADAECGGGERCDSFGRCRGTAESALVPVPGAATAGVDLQPLSSALRVDATTGEGVLFVTANNTGGAARLLGREGAEIQCPGGEFATECELRGLPEGVSTFPVRFMGAPMDDVGRISLFSTGGTHSVVSVQRNNTETRAPFSTEFAGIYRGVAALTASGLDDPADPGPAPVEAVRLPLTIELFGTPDSATIRLDNRQGAFGSGPVVGTLAVSESGDGFYEGTATFPVQPYLASSLGEGADYTVLSEVVEATVRLRDTPRILEIELAQRFLGLGPDTRPAARWSFELTRTGDVVGAAPSVGSDATLPVDDGELEATAVPWEARVDSVMQGRSQFFEEYLWEPDGPNRESWSACFDLGLNAEFSSLGYGTGVFSPADPTGSEVDSPLTRAMLTAQATLGSGRTSWSTASWTTDELSRDMPCEGTADITVDWNGSSTTDSTAFNTCALLRERTGCSIGAPGEEQTTTVSGLFRGTTSGGATPVGSFSGTMRWARTCTLPDNLAYCASSAACVEADSTNAIGGLLGDHPAGAPAAVSRAVDCAATGGSLALEADQQTDNSTTTVAALIDACIADIQTLRGPAPNPTTGGFLSEADRVFGRDVEPGTQALDLGTCLDPARLLIAVRHGLGTARNSDAPTEAVVEAGAFALRRLGRWLEIHGLVASEAVAQAAMAAALDEGDTEEANVRLEQSLGGWDLLFHPRFAGSIGQLRGEVLQEQDYRVPVIGVSTRRSDPQQKSLSAAIFDTIASQLVLEQTVIEEAAIEFEPDSALEQFRAAMPRALLASAIAYGLYGRAAEAAPGELAWEAGFRASEARAITAFGTVQSAAYRLESGANPLGIEDVDLPLYFTAEGTAADGSFGPGGRYSAVSDFLLGTGPGSTAWAPSLVARAQSSLDAARTGFLSEVDRTFRADVGAVEHERWVSEVTEQFNVRLYEYCGSSTTGSPVEDPDFRSENCAIDAANPICVSDPGNWYESWTESDVLGRVCMAREITAGGELAFADEAARAFAEACIPPNAFDATSAWDVVEIAACEGGMCLSCVADGAVTPLPLQYGTLELLAAIVPLPEVHVSNSSEVMQPVVRTEALEICRGRLPTMREQVPQPQSALDIPDCLTGSIGEAYLDVVSSTRALDSARAAHSELTERYDIAVRSCANTELAGEEADSLRSTHQTNMVALFQGRAVADSAVAVAGAAKECLATITAGVNDSPWGAAAGIATATGACVAGAVEATAQIASIAITGVIDDAQIAHENEMASLAEGSELWNCYNDALAELVGMHRAALDIEQAAFELQGAHANIVGLHADAQRTWLNGYHYVAELADGTARPTGSDIWIDERVETFTREMRLARRTTYLALRAVEFEQQQTFAARSAIYEAATPADLEAVLLSLWTSAGTRTVGGSRPSDLTVVLSLRDDILRLGDETDRPASLHPLTPTERFRLALADQSNAVYDEEGTWTGQRIPFELIPLGAFGFDAGAVPIYADTDCAERIWSVNASILGTDVVSGSDTSFVRVDLLKRNTFFSQWCGGAPEGQPYQMASTRPTRNLFREPGEGELVGGELGTEFNVSSDTRARIQAFLNVDQGTLETPDYASGESAELAARGLFGQYALFIPASLIAQESNDGSYDEGLVLDRVDDILLRLDYVSVAR